MMTKPWTEGEDRLVTMCYPSRGARWDGWHELLPERSSEAIATRARRLGVVRTRSRVGGGDANHYGFEFVKVPDPCESKVTRMMREGLTPDEIDRRMHWWPSTTKRILAEMWSREEE